MNCETISIGVVSQLVPIKVRNHQSVHLGIELVLNHQGFPLNIVQIKSHPSKLTLETIRTCPTHFLLFHQNPIYI